MFRRTVSVVLLLVALVLAGTDSVAAATQINLILPVSGVATNPCNGDSFPYAGAMHLLINETFSTSGGFHLDQMDNFADVKSTAPAVPSGSNYLISQTDKLSLNISSSGTTSETIVDHLNEISQGSAPNFLFHSTFHITLLPDGTVTANVSDVRFSC
jgi:hypothetical protein